MKDKTDWNATPSEAVAIQKEIRNKVRITPFGKIPRLIAGVDVSMNLYSNIVYAGFIVLTFPELEVVDHSVVRDETHFPYIPGLLSFREIPSLLKAWKQLKTKPELLFVDRQEIAHPRRLGIASHLGVELDVASIGCAKSILIGVSGELPPKAGSFIPLIDPKTDEKIGAVVRTKDTAKPMIISPGHMITIEESVDLVLQATKTYRMPEPTRLAHTIMNEYRIAYNSNHQ